QQATNRPTSVLVQVAPAWPVNDNTHGATSNQTPNQAFVLSATGVGLPSAMPAEKTMTPPQITAFHTTAGLFPRPIQGDIRRKAPSARFVQSIHASDSIAEFFLRELEFMIVFQGWLQGVGVNERKACPFRSQLGSRLGTGTGPRKICRSYHGVVRAEAITLSWRGGIARSQENFG